MRRWLALFIATLLPVLLAAPVWAASNATQGRGLLISPLRQYSTVSAGTAKTGSFTVGNLTKQAIVVRLSIKQFSVNDYAYNYTFMEPSKKWISLEQTEVRLEPNQSKKVNYTFTVESGSAPGGYYYTLVASSQLSQTGLASTVQAASLLYITVKGTLTKTSQHVGNTAPRIVTGKDVAYSVSVKNTGNVHYFAYVSADVHGLFGTRNPNGTSHLLLPGKIRQISSSVPSPSLPGFYNLTYGYKTDAGIERNDSRIILFIPPWSIALAILVGFVVYYLRRRRRVAIYSNR